MWVLLSSWCLTSFHKCLWMQKSVFIQVSDSEGVKATKELSLGGDTGTENMEMTLIYASR